MIESLVITLVILLCLYLADYYVIPPLAEPIRWVIRAIMGLIAILAICRVWGLL